MISCAAHCGCESAWEICGVEMEPVRGDSRSWRLAHVYAALLAAGVLEPRDALCSMRYHGLEAMKYLMPHPVLSPPGCEKPVNV